MKKKIAFISAYNTSFVKRDIESLSEHYEINRLDYTGIEKGVMPLLKQFWQILSAVNGSDLAFVWFADLRAFITGFICKIMRKKMLVVVGGYEMANHPEISYGAMIGSFSRWRVKKIFEWSSNVLVVDESLKLEAVSQIKADPQKIITIPTGFDTNLFKPAGEKTEEVLLVASVKVEQTLFVKGIYNYLEVARQMPEVRFSLVGIRGYALELLQNQKPENLEIIGFLQQDELIAKLQKTKVYCQLSLREGLPNALCEAMLCNCIPVGTKVNGIPNAIGNTGFLVKHGDIGQTVDAIKQALKKQTTDEPRQRITELFPKNRRITKLKETIEQL